MTLEQISDLEKLGIKSIDLIFNGEKEGSVLPKPKMSLLVEDIKAMRLLHDVNMVHEMTDVMIQELQNKKNAD